MARKIMIRCRENPDTDKLRAHIDDDGDVTIDIERPNEADAIVVLDKAGQLALRDLLNIALGE